MSKTINAIWVTFGQDGVPYGFPTRKSAREGGKLISAKGDPIKFVRA